MDDVGSAPGAGVPTQDTSFSRPAAQTSVRPEGPLSEPESCLFTGAPGLCHLGGTSTIVGPHRGHLRAAERLIGQVPMVEGRDFAGDFW